MIYQIVSKRKFINLANNPCILVRAPMRLTLAGGGTDITWYSKVHGGRWISAALDKYVYILISNQKAIGRNSIVLRNETINNCFRLFPPVKNVSVFLYSDVPAGSGLGGSGALEVCLLTALSVLFGRRIDPITIAKKASRIEIEILQRPVGPQDQFISALGGIREFSIGKSGQVTYKTLALTKSSIKKLLTNLIFLSTSVNRSSASILQDLQLQAAKPDQSEKVIRMLNEIKNLGIRAGTYLKEGKMNAFGKTFHLHWIIKKTLGSKVSNAKIDRWYNKGLENGALGGKIMGAGGGGWFVFYVNRQRIQFIKSMEKIGLKNKKVSFDWDGVKVIKNTL